MSKKKVAIIGAGVSGLLSAKYALEYDLIPVVFEKTAQIGGLWNSKETAIWYGMKTNVTKYVSQFSDHPWPNNTRLYPFSNEVYEYFLSYVKKFDLEKYILLNHKVTFVRRLESKNWEITVQVWDVSGRIETRVEIFDYLIIASGIYSKPRIPQYENSLNFKGLILHSSQFRLDDTQLKGKNVVVVGGAVSGIDISGHLVGRANSVVHIFRRSPFVMPLLWKQRLNVEGNDSSNIYSIMPNEFINNTRARNNTTLSADEFKSQRKIFLKNLFPFQANKNPRCPEALHVDFDNPNNELITGLSDNYIDHVKDDKIKPIKSQMKSFGENGVYLENGEYIAADVVLFCTGFNLGLDYLDKPILEALKYREDKPKFPILFYKCTFVPTFETMALVGHYARIYFTGYELQAMWVASVFSGKTSLPSDEIMNEYVRKLEMKRNVDNGVQFPYGTYVQLHDQIASELGIMPNLKVLESKDPELYDYLWNDEVLWSHFLYDKRDRAYFMNMLKEIREYKSKIYELNPNEQDIRQSDVIEQFSKNYKF